MFSPGRKSRSALLTGGVHAAGYETLERRSMLSAYAFNSVSLPPEFVSGAHPQSQLVFDSAGNLYGTTEDGGPGGYGTVFEIAKNTTTVITLGAFTGSNGANPYAGVVIDANGNLFGTTQSGGTSNRGTVFEIVAGSSTITTLGSFNVTNGSAPLAGVTIGPNGNLVGTTYNGGAYGNGTVFQVANGSTGITTIAQFDNYDLRNGASPLGGVTFDSSGNMFGTTASGGAYNSGTVFEIPVNTNTITTLVSFNSANHGPGFPLAGVTLDASGNIFGTTELGGTGYDGIVFEIPHGTTTLNTIASFNGTNGNAPHAALTLDSSGDIFGTTLYGGQNGLGVAFEVPANSSTISDLISFSLATGSHPQAGLTFDSSGDAFGTLNNGGPLGFGSVFELAHGSFAFSSVSTFVPTNSNTPVGTVAIDSAGNIFGATTAGGTFGAGSIFEIPAGTSTVNVIYSFDGTLGTAPAGGLTFDSSGNLFGSTSGGGTNGDGSVFEIPQGSTTPILRGSFNYTNGEYPAGPLTITAAGDIYGTALYGGSSGNGTVFEIVHGTNTVVAVASFDGVIGSNPQDGVVLNSAGDIFGALNFGGSAQSGSIFKIAHGTSAITTLVSFTSDSTGYLPDGLAIDPAGDLFGTTQQGGASNNSGTIFEVVNGTAAITTLANFSGPDGRGPMPGVIRDSAGNLFGETTGGGAYDLGTVFELPVGASSVTTLATFKGSSGSAPNGGLTLTVNGNLYGDTPTGGASNGGAVFTLTAYTPATLNLTGPGFYFKLDANPQQLDYWTNVNASGAMQSVPLASISNIAVTATGSSNGVVVDFANGSPLNLPGLSFAGTGYTQSILSVIGLATGNVNLSDTAITVTGSFGTIPISYTNSAVAFRPVNASGLTTQSIGTLSVASGKRIVLAAPTSQSARTAFVVQSFSDAGQLDLTGNDLVLKNTSIGTITPLLQSGFASGAENGQGIISTTALAAQLRLTTLGAIQNSIDGTTTGSPLYGSGSALGNFDGISPTASDVLIKYTYFGDTNLDGKVDATDYGRIDSASLANATAHAQVSSGWFNGDFNYDTIINGSDYTLIDNAFNNQTGRLSAQVASITPTVVPLKFTPAVPQAASIIDSSIEKSKKHVIRTIIQVLDN